MPNPQEALRAEIAAQQQRLDTLTSQLLALTSVQEENDALRAQITTLNTTIAQLTEERDAAIKALEDYKASHSDTPPIEEPPVVLERPAVTQIRLNLSAVVGLLGQFTIDRYNRFQNPCIIGQDYTLEQGIKVPVAPGTFKLTFHKCNFSAGGARAAFLYPKYGLLINGIERATATVAGGANQGVFSGALGDEPDSACVETQIVAYDAAGNRVGSPTESLMRFFIVINRQGKAKDDQYVIAQSNSYDWIELVNTGIGARYSWVKMPKKAIGNIARPLAPRNVVPFDTALPSTKIERIALQPHNTMGLNQTHYPVVDKDGVVTTNNGQAYESSLFAAKISGLPKRDGERNQCDVSYPVFMRLGRNGKTIHFDPQSMRITDATGKTWTVLGKRTTAAPCRTTEGPTEETPYTEIVGDWDASIPPAERFPWECWGMVWDTRTLALDMAAAPINGEQPHVGLGPVAYMADRHGYVLRAQFNGGGPAALALFGNTDRNAPPKITRYIVAPDMWGLYFDPATFILYGAVRQEHRIGKWNVDDPVTPQFLGNLIENPAGNQLAYFDPEGSVTHNAHIRPGVSLATARSANIVAPELIEGFGDWIRYGSFVSRDLKEVHKTTGEIRTVCRPDASVFDGSNRFFFYFSQSDGTFGPAGTVFITTFANVNQGWPLAYIPSPGADADGTPLTHTKTWAYHEYIVGPTCGVRGSMWAPYGMASACGQGRLVCGAAGWGLSEFIQTTKPAPDFAKLARGLQYFMGKDYHLIYGSSGFDSKYPFAFGESGDLDYWADHHGIPRA